jgi:hypothetical protein
MMSDAQPLWSDAQIDQVASELAEFWSDRESIVENHATAIYKAMIQMRDTYEAKLAASQPAAQQTDVLICDKCNDHLAAPSYCDVCYGTLESAYQEAENEVTALKQPAAQPLAAIVAQLRSCNYTCEAGALADNIAWLELERLAAQESN